MASTASRMAERISPSDTPMEKSARRSFQASNAVAITITAAGAMVWPRPHRMPAMPVTSIAVEVVSSVPWPARSDEMLRISTSRPVSASVASP